GGGLGWRDRSVRRIARRLSSGRDAAALYPRSGGWRRARQLSCPPELLRRRPPICRRRAPPRRRAAAEGSHRPYRRETAMVSQDRPSSEHEIVAELRLHPDRPRVTRLSRKVLVGLASLATMAVLAAILWALDHRRTKEAAPKLYNTEHKTTADELSRLPRDYSGLPPGVPPLGPPLPGDLGRPLLHAQ